jgi:hypothetical protein
MGNKALIHAFCSFYFLIRNSYNILPLFSGLLKSYGWPMIASAKGGGVSSGQLHQVFTHLQKGQRQVYKQSIFLLHLSVTTSLASAPISKSAITFFSVTYYTTWINKEHTELERERLTRCKN